MVKQLCLALAVALALPPLAPAAQLMTLPVLDLHVEPAAALYVDGRLVAANQRDFQVRLAAGPHRLRIVHETYVDVRRTVDLVNGETTALTILLADQSVPKVRGRAPAMRDSRVADPDLTRAIQFVAEGDFKPAVETLDAVTRNLANVPRLQRELALAYLYQAIAYAGLNDTNSAIRAMVNARRDLSVAPSSGDFPPQIVRLWQDAESPDARLAAEAAAPRPVANEPVTLSNLPPPPTPVAAAPVAAEGGGSVLEVDFLPSVDREFVAGDTQETALSMSQMTNGRPCPGVLTLRKLQRMVSWMPTGNCSEPFEVPYAELRTPAAAPQGGLLLQFRSERPSMIVMPQPDADLLDPGAEPAALNDLPAAVKVNMRKAQRRMLEALGRPQNDSMFGLQLDLPLEEITTNAAQYDGAFIRTRGSFGTRTPGKAPYLLIGDHASLELLPSSATQTLLRSNIANWQNKEVIVSGTFTLSVTARMAKGSPPASGFSLTVSTIEPAERLAPTGPGREMTLQQVVTGNVPARDQLVRVVGRYRGLNFYGDLPIDSRRAAGDWVIKDQTYAIWVMGHDPAGDGFQLTHTYSVDMASWLAVTGTIEERRGFIYLHAKTVEVTPPPSEQPIIPDGSVQRRRSSTPPEIGFVAPVEEVEDASIDQQFLLRFTKPMDETTFKDHVVVRYADDTDIKFKNVAVTYYGDRTFSVLIDPGRAFEPGKTIELVLLPGIKDVDGIDLSGVGTSGRTLRWKVSNDAPK